MTERLQKIIAQRGVCSRRKAEELILAGRVRVNGIVAKLGESADPDMDRIELDGASLPSIDEKVYIMLNKPRGYVTTLSDEKGRPNVSQLVDIGVRIYPVGRLDMDSEGLLIMTNDGDLADRLMHPRGEVRKTYEVWATGYMAGSEKLLERPITLDGYTIRPPKVELLDSRGDKGHFLITIHEGRNRQVRRMCQAAGMQVTRLRRISEGSLKLGDLKKGCWRHLTPDEIQFIKNKMRS